MRKNAHKYLAFLSVKFFKVCTVQDKRYINFNFNINLNLNLNLKLNLNLGH